MPEKDPLPRLIQRWFQTHGRDLPWRRTRDPYRVWISEIMLQQTQVSRVIPFYDRFLRRYPRLSTLAASSWRELLPYWRGLGYYQRGRNLLAAAKVIRDEHKGRFPKKREALLALPGVGIYTASAIRSLCFDFPEPALDTNLLRVFSRYWGCPSTSVKARAADLFARSRIDSRALNFALMDLGSSLCSARKPQCESCPLRTRCHFFRSGSYRVAASSGPKRKRAAAAVDVGVGCIHRDGEYLIAKRRRSHGGNWEFPGGKREAGESIRSCIKRELKEELGIEVAVRPAFHVEEFQDGDRLWRLHFCRCRILRGTPRPHEHEKLSWITAAKLYRHPFPKRNRSALERLLLFR